MVEFYQHFHQNYNNYRQSSERNIPRRQSTNRHFKCLHVEPNTHPFFARVWYVRHTLDINSPMIKPHVKEAIMKNEGQWPLEMMNDFECIRDALVPFRHIVSCCVMYSIFIVDCSDGVK